MQQILNVYLTPAPPLPPITYDRATCAAGRRTASCIRRFPCRSGAVRDRFAAGLRRAGRGHRRRDRQRAGVPGRGSTRPPPPIPTIRARSDRPIRPIRCNVPGQRTRPACLPAQIQAAKNINQGAADSHGTTVQAPAGAVAPDHVDNTVLKATAYDGGWMTTVGIPSRKIGTCDIAARRLIAGQVAQLPYGWLTTCPIRLTIR